MLLPPPERRDEIRFIFAKSLPYNTRLALIICCFGIGLFFQAVFSGGVPFWIGAAFILMGALLGVVRGYSNVPRKFKRARGEFEKCTRKEFEDVLEINRRSKRWDASPVDVTCPLGALTLAGLLLGLAFLWWYLGRAGQRRLGNIIAVDGLAFFFPYWVTGVKSILKSPRLIIKIENFLKLSDYFETIKGEGEEIEYWLRTAEADGGEVPCDAKLVVKFTGAPSSFLGLQVQISINSVQGNDYPYMYCVIVARHDFGLHPKKPSLPGLTVGASRDADVDVVVIRQRTTRTSGYHTRFRAMKRILARSLEATREVLSLPVSPSA